MCPVSILGRLNPQNGLSGRHICVDVLKGKKKKQHCVGKYFFCLFVFVKKEKGKQGW